MGNSLFKYFFGNKEVRILFLGLDAAGKTTILYTLKLGEVVTTIPTIGFNVETLHMKSVDMTAWDVGVRDKMRPLYRHYYPNTHGLVYVIDSSDTERLDEAMGELQYITKEDDIRDIPALILANKQDIDNALSAEEMEQKIQDKKCMSDRQWAVFGVTATHVKDSGLSDAFEWLANAIVEREKNKMATGLLNGARPKTTKHKKDTPVENDKETKAKHFFCSFVESFKKMIT